MKKKTGWAVLTIILLLLLWLWFNGSRETASLPETADPPSFALGEDRASSSEPLLVDFKNEASPAQIQALEKKYSLRLKLDSRFSLVERLYRGSAQKLQPGRLLAQLRSEPLIENAELDTLYSIPPGEGSLTAHQLPAFNSPEPFPNDPQFRYQWHLNQINMPEAWSQSTGQGVIVAVIDTGVAYQDAGIFKRVPDLRQTEIVEGYDFVNHRALALDDHGHGTHVAGTIAQSTNNGIGVAGVAYQARLMPLKVLSARGFGSVADIAEAVRFATDHGAKVINMSLGGNRSSNILASAVKYAHHQGVVVICAAGNDGKGRVSYPAAYPGAIAVAATQYDGKTTFYSNWGKEIDLAAPGGNTRLDQNGDGLPDGVLQNTIVPGHPEQSDYLLFMGTSMASPHVAGVAALVIASGVTSPDAVENVLKSTARHPEGKHTDPHYGSGIIDAGAALTKTTTHWGIYKLSLSSLLALFLMLRLRQKGNLGLRPGPGLVLGLLLSSSGFFFIPAPSSSNLLVNGLWQVFHQGFPLWDHLLLGAAAHANPLFYSALAPLLMTIVFWRAPRWSGFLTGFSLGLAGHLCFQAAFFGADVIWIPNVFFLDQAFLLLNAVACYGLGMLIARRT
jgi:serine protease